MTSMPALSCSSSMQVRGRWSNRDRAIDRERNVFSSRDSGCCYGRRGEGVYMYDLKPYDRDGVVVGVFSAGRGPQHCPDRTRHHAGYILLRFFGSFGKRVMIPRSKRMMHAQNIFAFLVMVCV